MQINNCIELKLYIYTNYNTFVQIMKVNGGTWLIIALISIPIIILILYILVGKGNEAFDDFYVKPFDSPKALIVEEGQYPVQGNVGINLAQLGAKKGKSCGAVSGGNNYTIDTPPYLYGINAFGTDSACDAMKDSYHQINPNDKLCAEVGEKAIGDIQCCEHIPPLMKDSTGTCVLAPPISIGDFRQLPSWKEFLKTNTP